jgi:hypothetical protein
MQLLQVNPYNPGKSHFATPYDSSVGVPLIVAVVVIIVIIYVVFRVWWSLRKDKKTELEKERNKNGSPIN